MNMVGTVNPWAGHPISDRFQRRRSPGCPCTCGQLQELADAELATISSERLAEMAGVNAAKVRKDLSYFGSYGTRGVGYDVDYLLFQIRRELGLTHDWPCVIVGMGNLGQALANYAGFRERGLHRRRPDRQRRGEGRHRTSAASRSATSTTSPALVAEKQITIGVIATPAPAAQEVASRMVTAGITSILNFAPTVIAVPEEVSVRKVDLAVELQILSFYNERRSSSPHASG